MNKYKIFLCVLAGIFLILGVSIYIFIQHSKTDYNFEIFSSVIINDVRIVFDEMAVPHIYAESETDAMFALGYVHASERLWQMDLLRRAGGGELSELLVQYWRVQGSKNVRVYIKFESEWSLCIHYRRECFY